MDPFWGESSGSDAPIKLNDLRAGAKRFFVPALLVAPHTWQGSTSRMRHYLVEYEARENSNLLDSYRILDRRGAFHDRASAI
jgi:hypothetical protein